MNAAEYLIEKSKKNSEIATYSASQKYYDTAISRHYYSIYQRLLFVLYSYVDSYNVKRNNGEGSHELAFKEYRKYALKRCKKKLEADELTDVANLDQYLGEIKKFRIEADYAQRMINEDEYEKEFIVKLDRLSNVLLKIEPFLERKE